MYCGVRRLAMIPLIRQNDGKVAAQLLPDGDPVVRRSIETVKNYERGSFTEFPVEKLHGKEYQAS
jgi:hypothetical protein